MNFKRTTPCANCPFRSDIRPFIYPERAREILEGEGTFPCHKTVDYSVDADDGDGLGGAGRVHEKSQQCAGVLIVREHIGRPNQIMRIAERLGMYDHTKLDMHAPVYKSIDEAVAAHEANYP